jgi:hypothetical protein
LWHLAIIPLQMLYSLNLVMGIPGLFFFEGWRGFFFAWRTGGLFEGDDGRPRWYLSSGQVWGKRRG